MRLLIPILIAAAAVTGCDSYSTTTSPAPAARGNEAWPTRDEVLAYLDGKAIPLTSDPAGGAAEVRKWTFRPDRVEAVEVVHEGSHSGGPWTTPVHLIVDTDDGQFAVTLQVSHQLIECRRAFYGYEFVRAARQ